MIRTHRLTCTVLTLRIFLLVRVVLVYGTSWLIQTVPVSFVYVYKSSDHTCNNQFCVNDFKRRHHSLVGEPFSGPCSVVDRHGYGRHVSVTVESVPCSCVKVFRCFQVWEYKEFGYGVQTQNRCFIFLHGKWVYPKSFYYQCFILIK